MVARKPILLKNLNDTLTCSLCSGYFIDATKLLDCMHTFCRSCILKYFENSSVEKCPICRQPCKEKRPDMTLQTLVYKIVPGLYSREISRREDFYRTAGVRASSSCSDDSVIGDNMEDHEEWIYTLGSENPFLSGDDSISLSLEYYQSHLDNSAEKNSATKSDKSVETIVEKSDVKIDNSSAKNDKENGSVNNKENNNDIKDNNNKAERRFLQCPAAVQMTHLQKFLRMKFALCEDHKVDVIYAGEVLPSHFTLMDVAYTFKWDRTKPLRFFYRIFTQGKVKPIKIINTSTTVGQKQLQVVPMKTPSVEQQQKAAQEALSNKLLEDEQMNKDKERLMSELKLQVRKKPIVVENHNLTVKLGEIPKIEKKKVDISFTPFHHDEEMKKFAESRDREWQLLSGKNPDEEHKSKKRKKNKHSKDQPHKKPKLHAEITSEASLKLKVKLTQHNGHKHKHHKSTNSESRSHLDQTSKEKINQLRQIRHKSANNEDKTQKVEIKKPEKEKAPKEAPNIEIKIDKPQEVKPPQQSQVIIKKDIPSRPSEVKIDAKPKVMIEKSKVMIDKPKVILEKPKVMIEKPKQIPPEKPKVEKLKIEEKKTAQSEKAIRQQIQRLHPQPKPKTDQPKPDQKKMITLHQYLPGFTVSKIEQGVKRKLETDEPKDQRPSLEITPIRPQQPPIKRPPPPTIPLERIKNSVNFSGVSIIPKQPEKLAQTGPLDLSKPHKLELKPEIVKNGNGIKITDKSALSNLQMLSKVATEHPNVKQTINMSPKPKPQMPNLETIKIPQVPQKSSLVQTDKKLPKLHEIGKGQFKMMNPTRTIRPIQNQCIRNIPNPSLLVRQQNQNRLNCLNMTPKDVKTPEKKVDGASEKKTEDNNKPSNLITT